ncbi:glutamate 5-kinase [Patescibacteria group bacterium]|nr:glutamate 5-kinase [Patescibacteria group bacterium]
MKEIIVVKVGTNTLTANGSNLNNDLIANLVKQLAKLHEQGYQVVLVTSGAVAAGKEALYLSNGDNTIVKRQVYASVGQARLMHKYENFFAEHGLNIGQALLTHDDFCHRARYDNALQTLHGLLDSGIIPVINENDVVTINELSFGDNDVLAATTAIAIGASKLIFLTNQEGVMTDNPNKNSDARLIDKVEDAKEIFSVISDGLPSSGGIGGMFSKVNAARIATSAGVATWVASGLRPANISDIVQGKKIGTYFVPKKTTLTAKSRWILCAKNASTGVYVDAGAVKALTDRKSLLMVGIHKIKGFFEAKQIIEVIDDTDRIVGYGVVNYDSESLKAALDNPRSLDKEIIHADNFRLI